MTRNQVDDIVDAEREVLQRARAWRRFSHTKALLDAVRALQAADAVPTDEQGVLSFDHRRAER